MRNLDSLKKEVDKLKNLLQKDQIGLSTWHEAVQDSIKRIAEYAKGKYNE